MTTYDVPRSEAVDNLERSVGSFLANQILAALDEGGSVQSDVTVFDGWVPGSNVPAGTDIIIASPGVSGLVNVPPGVGGVLFTGPTGVQVSLSVDHAIGVQLTEGSDVVSVSDVVGSDNVAISVNLGAGDDVYFGADNAMNNVIGGAGDDVIHGGSKNNSFDLGEGNDVVDAGDGYDKAYVRGGSIHDFTSVINSDGSVSLTNIHTGEVTTMKNLEFVTFEGGGVMLNVTTETAFAAASLYEVILGRGADAEGHEFYAETSGTTLIEAANGMLGSDEFTSKFGAVSEMSDSQFLDVMYHTAFHRAGDEGGMGYWLDQLSSGMSRGEVAVRFAYSSEAQSEFSSTINFIDKDHLYYAS